MSTASTQEQLRGLRIVHAIGIALAAERNRDRLLERILLEAKVLCHADGGTLYLREEHLGVEQLRFVMGRNDSLGLAFGGTSGTDATMPAVPLKGPDGQPNYSNVASYAALHNRTVAVADAYREEGDFDFTGVRAFDAANGYRSMSFLAIPLRGSRQQVIGVLQLINASDPLSGALLSFSQSDIDIVEALAAQAGVTLDNQLLLDGQKTLLESFIRLIAEAIDAKSAHTGGHCERVPVLTEMLTQAVCKEQQGSLRGFSLNDEEWYELRIAAWLHDCGKVVTPVHIMDKSTKLEGIFDRVLVVRERFEVLRREAQIALLRGECEEAGYAERIASLDDDLAFLERANLGGEFLDEADKHRLRSIAGRPYPDANASRGLLSEDELQNLLVSRGTLTPAERLAINGHMVQTIQMLESLPFPENLKRVPEYACGHHERMDGKGYPRGLFAGDMSVPARIMAIADVFEALTAQDRPYKQGKKLSETMAIMGRMKRDNHLDPELFDLFVRSQVYRTYAERYLPATLVDAVDEDALLAIVAIPFELSPKHERQGRMDSLLPEYESLRSRALKQSPSVAPPALDTAPTRSSS